MLNPKHILVLIVLVLLPALFTAPSAYAQDAAPYRLVGTIEGQDFAGAVFDDSSGQKFYRLGEPMPDGSRIIKVESGSIVLKRSDGSRYELFVRGTKPSPQPPRRAAMNAAPPSTPSVIPNSAAAAPPPHREPDHQAGQPPMPPIQPVEIQPEPGHDKRPDKRPSHRRRARLREAAGED